MNKIIEKILSQSQLSRQEAWWLLEWAADKSKEQLLTGHDELSEEIILKIDAAAKKIDLESMPLAYVIGHVPFGELTIDVQPPLLIPRPETEEWVYRLIEKLQPEKERISTILDLGTGSGCIALALANAFPAAQVTASDINPRALELAEQNARKNGINNICFIESNLFQNIPLQKFDLIVSNPPYIAPAYKETLSRSVINWEDHGALFAADHGLKLITEIIQQLPQRLSNSNLSVQFAIECDPEQIKTIIDLCAVNNVIGIAAVDAFNNQRLVWGCLACQ